MKGGSIVRWRTMVGVVGSTSPGTTLRPSASFGLWESRAEWPCSVGIRSERVEAVGRKARTTWIVVVGLADETSVHEPALRYISRSLVSASAVHHSMSWWRRAFRRVGGLHRTAVWRKDGVRILERVNVGKKITGGVKIIRAQHYAGVDSFETIRL